MSSSEYLCLSFAVSREVDLLQTILYDLIAISRVTLERDGRRHDLQVGQVTVEKIIESQSC